MTTKNVSTISVRFDPVIVGFEVWKSYDDGSTSKADLFIWDDNDPSEIIDCYKKIRDLQDEYGLDVPIYVY